MTQANTSPTRNGSEGSIVTSLYLALKQDPLNARFECAACGALDISADKAMGQHCRVCVNAAIKQQAKDLENLKADALDRRGT